MPPMLALIDENVPRAVSDFLAQRGHEVALVRDWFAAGTQDPVIANAASREKVVFFTWNHKHFRQYRSQFAGRAGLVAFTCKEPRGLARLRQFIREVEQEYELFASRETSVMWLEIGDSYFKNHR